MARAALALLALLSAQAQASGEDANPSCEEWAAVGECTRNAGYMLAECRVACAKARRDPGSTDSTLEQCLGWAEQGECTRNPGFMLAGCAAACGERRALALNARIDEDADCAEWGAHGGCARESDAADAAKRARCVGTCAIIARCADARQFEPSICQAALRCQELMDADSACEARARAGECAAGSTARHMLTSCFLSCALHDLESILARYMDRQPVHVKRARIERPRPPSPAASRGRDACWTATAYASARADASAPARSASLANALRNATLVATCWPAGGADGARTVSAIRAHYAAFTPRVWHAGGAVRTVAPAAAAADAAAAAARTPDEGYDVVYVTDSPRIRLLRGFVSASEAAEVIRLATPRFGRSMAGQRVESVRTSSTAYLDNDSDEVVRAIVRRASVATGYAPANIEPLQVVRYRAGEEYKPHYDFGFECDLLENLHMGRRHVTMLVYLNDLSADGPDGEAGAGGCTSFPLLGLRVRPRLGTALVFNDCADDGASDRRTLHGGEPPAPGVLKYAINIWIRANAFAQSASSRGAAELEAPELQDDDGKAADADASSPARRRLDGDPSVGRAALRKLRASVAGAQRAGGGGGGGERASRSWWRWLLQ